MSDFSSRRVSGLAEEKQRYEFKYACKSCGHKWKRTVTTNEPFNVVDPPCPKCSHQRKAQVFDFASGKAPAAVGMNASTQAIDLSAKMVMEDYGMTDIKGPGEVRAGESSAPKIAPHLQTMADRMFQPHKQLQGVGLGAKAGAIAQSAMHGGYSAAAHGTPDPVAVAQHGRKPVQQVARIINEGAK